MKEYIYTLNTQNTINKHNHILRNYYILLIRELFEIEL